MEPAEDKVKVEYGTDVAFVTLREASILDEGQIRELEGLIMPVVEEAGGKRMDMNFANVEFMSSSMLGLLVKIHKRVAERGGHLSLINLDSNLQEVFRITNLHKVFDIS